MGEDADLIQRALEFFFSHRYSLEPSVVFLSVGSGPVDVRALERARTQLVARGLPTGDDPLLTVVVEPGGLDAQLADWLNRRRVPAVVNGLRPQQDAFCLPFVAAIDQVGIYFWPDRPGEALLWNVDFLLKSRGWTNIGAWQVSITPDRYGSHEFEALSNALEQAISAAEPTARRLLASSLVRSRWWRGLCRAGVEHLYVSSCGELHPCAAAAALGEAAIGDLSRGIVEPLPDQHRHCHTCGQGCPVAAKLDDRAGHEAFCSANRRLARVYAMAREIVS